MVLTQIKMKFSEKKRHVKNPPFHEFVYILHKCTRISSQYKIRLAKVNRLSQAYSSFS